MTETKAPMHKTNGQLNGTGRHLQVQETMDYGAFRVLDGNRMLNALHLARLKNSMQEKFLISPIIVNDKMEVIDGQHRLQASMELKLPVYYIVVDGYGLAEVQRLNTNLKNWDADDFMEGYIQLGIKDYARYKQFKAKYGFAHADCQSLLCGDSRKWVGGAEVNNMKMFQEGKMRIKDYDKAVHNADKIMLTAPFYAGYKRRSYIRALVKLMQNKNFDIKEFARKLEMQRDRFYDCTTVDAYTDLIMNVYNYRRRNEGKVALVK